MGSTKKRSLIKAIIWELIGIPIVYLLTKDLNISLAYIIIRTIALFLWERGWKLIHWGKTNE